MRVNIWRRTLAVLAIALSTTAARGAGAQSVIADTLAEARRLRDAREFAAAVELLVPYVTAHPEDPGSARFAALMAYWAKDTKTADSIYASALERHGDDVELRLEYGRFLADHRRTVDARAVLAPIASVPRGQELLGTIAYWSGDYPAARRYFREALTGDSTRADARRQLAEIQAAASPWVRIGVSGWDDDQPLSYFTGSAEAGWFATPLTPFTVRARTLQFDADGTSETASVAEVSLATYVPAARLDLGAGGGVVQRTFGDGSDWVGHVSFGARLGGGVAVQLLAERAPYLNTTRSLATAVMIDGLEGRFRWRAPNGWMADAVARRELYPDDNDVTTGYLWALAPIFRRSTGTLRAGYSFTAQSAGRSRFVPRSDAVGFPPRQAPETVPGTYDPYYTPRNLLVHSALGSAELQPGPRWRVTGDAAYAISARDDAPVLVAVPSPPNVDIARRYYRRSFTPWRVRAGIDGSLATSVRLGLSAEHGRAAYYSYTSAGATLTYTFASAARRRAADR